MIIELNYLRCKAKTAKINKRNRLYQQKNTYFIVVDSCAVNLSVLFSNKLFTTIALLF